MDLSKLQSNSYETEFFIPGHGKTGLHLTLVDDTDEDVIKLDKQYQRRIRDAYVKNKKTQANKLSEEHQEKRLRAHVQGWRWEGDAQFEGEKLEFNEANLNRVLAHRVIGYHLKRFIEDEIGEAENFIETLESS